MNAPINKNRKGIKFTKESVRKLITSIMVFKIEYITIKRNTYVKLVEKSSK